LKRFVDGIENELDSTAAQVSPAGDRLWVRSEAGTHSALVVRQGDAVFISYRGRQFRIERRSQRAGGMHAAASGELIAPMPGQIVDVRVSIGDMVQAGDTLVVLEAMKTQQPIRAPFAGVVTMLKAEKGNQVTEGATLVLVESGAENSVRA